MKDQDIISLYISRNENAILETEKKYGGYCFTIAYNILKERMDSEECLNDMYIKAWGSIPPEIPKNLGAWLSKVIRNLAINLWKKNHRKKRYNGIMLLFDELEECIPESNSVEQVIEGIELTNFLNKWLDSLSKEDRVLFMRRYWFGEPLKILEKEYGMSHGKMAKRMYKLRSNLKVDLEREGYSL